MSFVTDMFQPLSRSSDQGRLQDKRSSNKLSVISVMNNMW